MSFHPTSASIGARRAWAGHLCLLVIIGCYLELGSSQLNGTANGSNSTSPVIATSAAAAVPPAGIASANVSATLPPISRFALPEEGLMVAALRAQAAALDDVIAAGQTSLPLQIALQQARAQAQVSSAAASTAASFLSQSQNASSAALAVLNAAKLVHAGDRNASDIAKDDRDSAATNNVTQQKASVDADNTAVILAGASLTANATYAKAQADTDAAAAAANVTYNFYLSNLSRFNDLQAQVDKAAANLTTLQRALDNANTALSSAQNASAVANQTAFDNNASRTANMSQAQSDFDNLIGNLTAYKATAMQNRTDFATRVSNAQTNVNLSKFSSKATAGTIQTQNSTLQQAVSQLLAAQQNATMAMTALMALQAGPSSSVAASALKAAADDAVQQAYNVMQAATTAETDALTAVGQAKAMVSSATNAQTSAFATLNNQDGSAVTIALSQYNSSLGVSTKATTDLSVAVANLTTANQAVATTNNTLTSLQNQVLTLTPTLDAWKAELAKRQAAVTLAAQQALVPSWTPTLT